MTRRWQGGAVRRRSVPLQKIVLLPVASPAAQQRPPCQPKVVFPPEQEIDTASPRL